jgi:hypothetical protein
VAEAKTKVNDASVEDFLDGLEPRRRADCKAVVAMMEKATKCPPKMWGGAIVGFGSYTYEYSSGTTGDWPRIGFSPRKQNLVLYIADGFADREALLSKLGKFKTGKVCVYVNSLADIDLKALEKLIKASLKHMKAKYPA